MQQIIPVGKVDFHIHRAGSGRPFLWTHGAFYSASADKAAGLFDWLAVEQPIELVAYDVRGHGESQSPDGHADDHTWPALAGDALAIASVMEIAPFVAGGMSLGAAVSLYAAMQSPEKISALVLVAPPAAWTDRSPQVRRYQSMAWLAKLRLLSLLLPIALGGRSVLPDFIARDMPEKEHIYRSSILGLKNAAAIPILEGMAKSDFPTPLQLAKLTQPTLILAWTGDANHPVSTAEALATSIPNAELVIAETTPEVVGWPRIVCEFVARSHNG
jgi:pimeloyl-ACP methyl ester carboxylesterase